MRTSVFELSRLPHAFFNLADLFLINKEETGRLSEPRDLRGKGEVMDVFQCIVEARSLVSANLEPPQVIVGVPWPFPQVMVRERIQRSSVLTAISWNDSYDMGVRAHDDPSVACRNAPSLAVGNDTGNEVNPAIEFKS